MDRAPALTDGVGAPDLAASLISTGLTLSALVLALSFPILGYYPMLLLSLDRRVRWLGGRLQSLGRAVAARAP